MLVAAIGSTAYDVVLILHLSFMVVAFAPAFVWPVMNRLQRTAARDEPNATSSNGGALGFIVDPMMHGASMVLTGVFGIGLISMSSEVFEFSQTWISLGFLLWFAMLGVFFGLLVPAQKAVREGVAAANGKLSMSYGIMHLLLLLQIIVMVFKPGL